MDAILKGTDANEAATAWLKANPDAVTPWLEGVTTFDGGDAKAAVSVRARRVSVTLGRSVARPEGARRVCALEAGSWIARARPTDDHA